MTEGGTYITFSPYMEGMAPALIINHTESYLKFIEHDLSEYLDEMLVILNAIGVTWAIFMKGKLYFMSIYCILKDT